MSHAAERGQLAVGKLALMLFCVGVPRG